MEQLAWEGGKEPAACIDQARQRMMVGGCRSETGGRGGRAPPYDIAVAVFVVIVAVMVVVAAVVGFLTGPRLRGCAAARQEGGGPCVWFGAHVSYLE